MAKKKKSLTNLVPRLALSLACIPCALESYLQLVQRNLVPAEKQTVIMRSLLHYFATTNYHQCPVQLGKTMHIIIREITQNPDPYQEIKFQSNQTLLARYPEFQKVVQGHADPLNTALRLAIAGNTLDLGVNHGLEFSTTLDRVLQTRLAIDDSQALAGDLKRAKSWLYLGDNAGEIVFDRLLLETIRHPRVYFGVRGAPIINDITLADAQQAGLHQLATVIPNGDNAPGTILADTSAAFQEIFNAVDLIIAKGQGNFESLYQLPYPVYFLLTVKCETVANILQVKKGDFVVLKNPVASEPEV
ncbi:ARMT1-like domain-containing protein [candidate division KSB1 bacterium]|nr:ARMT1-like domain-containing protein [candidate division KSB1 bacterium]